MDKGSKGLEVHGKVLPTGSRLKRGSAPDKCGPQGLQNACYILSPPNTGKSMTVKEAM